MRARYGFLLLVAAFPVACANILGLDAVDAGASADGAALPVDATASDARESDDALESSDGAFGYLDNGSGDDVNAGDDDAAKGADASASSYCPDAGEPFDLSFPYPTSGCVSVTPDVIPSDGGPSVDVASGGSDGGFSGITLTLPGSYFTTRIYCFMDMTILESAAPSSQTLVRAAVANQDIILNNSMYIAAGIVSHEAQLFQWARNTTNQVGFIVSPDEGTLTFDVYTQTEVLDSGAPFATAAGSSVELRFGMQYANASQSPLRIDDIQCKPYN